MSDERKMITFTPAKYRRLKLAYDYAVKEGQERFDFEGEVFVTAYAKYVLEYLKQRLDV